MFPRVRHPSTRPAPFPFGGARTRPGLGRVHRQDSGARLEEFRHEHGCVPVSIGGRHAREGLISCRGEKGPRAAVVARRHEKHGEGTSRGGVGLRGGEQLPATATAAPQRRHRDGVEVGEKRFRDGAEAGVTLDANDDEADRLPVAPTDEGLPLLDHRPHRTHGPMRVTNERTPAQPVHESSIRVRERSDVQGRRVGHVTLTVPSGGAASPTSFLRVVARAGVPALTR